MRLQPGVGQLVPLGDERKHRRGQAPVPEMQGKHRALVVLGEGHEGAQSIRVEVRAVPQHRVSLEHGLAPGVPGPGMRLSQNGPSIRRPKASPDPPLGGGRGRSGR